MRSRFIPLVLSAALAAGTLAVSEPAHAQEIVLTGPLKGAPPVKRLRLYRQNRLDISLMANFTLLDEYQHTFLFGGRLTYYFTDWIGVGVWGGVGVNFGTDLTSQIDNIAPRNQFTATNVAPCVPSSATNNPSAQSCGMNGAPKTTFSDQTAKLDWAIVPQVTAVPFRGKLALFQALFVDTEAYLFLGLGVTGFDQRVQCGGGGSQKACSDPTTFATSSSALFTVSGGLGLTFFVNDLINIGVEYRALVYPADGVNRGGFDSRGLGPGQNFPDGKVNGSDATDHLNHIIGVSVGFMLGGRKTTD